MGDKLKPIECYVSPAGNNKIADWYESLLIQEQADADFFILNMRKISEWSLPQYRPKLAGYKGIGELRWDSCNKKHRLIGFLKGGVFYALIGCTHKGSIYTPTDALDTADKRKRQIERGEVRTTVYDL